MSANFIKDPADPNSHKSGFEFHMGLRKVVSALT